MAELRSVDPRSLITNPNNPRRTATPKAMDDQLVASIRAIGIIQPPLVKETEAGLEIVAGNRRCNCAIVAGLDVIEGTGLVLEQAWAEFVTLILTASFLPLEVFEILRHVTWIRVALVVINLAVVVYLLYYVKLRIQERRLRRAGRA